MGGLARGDGPALVQRQPLGAGGLAGAESGAVCLPPRFLT